MPRPWNPIRACVETLPREVCLDPCFLDNFPTPRFAVELPRECDGAENSPKKKLLRERYGCKIMCFQCIARSSRSHRGTLFGKVVAHRYRETVLSITVGASFIGKNTGLQMFEILCVLRYRRF